MSNPPPDSSPPNASANTNDNDSSHEEEPLSRPEAPPRYPFVKLMALERLDGNADNYESCAHANGNGQPFKFERFRALVAPYRPECFKVAYGGHVYAQAAYAASKTVKKGFALHNITGSFTLPGMDLIPYTYTVRHIREGSTYCLRGVDVTQGDGVCFSCICSFKRAERNYSFEHQPVSHIQEKYKSVLEGKRIEDHPLAPGVDRPTWYMEVEQGITEELDFAGVEGRKVNMDKYNELVDAKNHKERYRQLQFYRFLGLPGLEDEGDAGSLEEIRKADEAGEYDNLYVCAHLFYSDRNSLFVIAWAHDLVEDITNIASLSHTVIFHTHGPALRMLNWDAPDEESRMKWFTLEMETSRAGENRGLMKAEVWGADGTLLASVIQDGLLRVSLKGKL